MIRREIILLHCFSKTYYLNQTAFQVFALSFRHVQSGCLKEHFHGYEWINTCSHLSLKLLFVCRNFNVFIYCKQTFFSWCLTSNPTKGNQTSFLNFIKIIFTLELSLFLPVSTSASTSVFLFLFHPRLIGRRRNFICFHKLLLVFY